MKTANRTTAFWKTARNCWRRPSAARNHWRRLSAARNHWRRLSAARNCWRRLSAALSAAILLGFLLSPAAAAQQPRSFSTGAGKGARTARAEYSLKVVFAKRDGAFLAGVEVAVFDESGAKVVETFSKGPWLFLDLPPGSYRVVARLEGGPGAAGEVKVGGKRQKSLYLTW